MSNIKARFAEKFEKLGGLMPLLDNFHPMSPQELAQIETKLGVQLPQSYRAFLLEIGAVCFGNLVFVQMIQKSPGGGAKKREPFDYFFGAAEEEDYGLLKNIEFYEVRVTPKVIPIGEDLMGNKIFLAIKGKKQGKVYFWDHDYGKFYLAAESFEDFLNRLEVLEELPPA